MIYNRCKILNLVVIIVASTLNLVGQEISVSSGLTISTQAYNKLLFQPTVQGHHNIISGFLRFGYAHKLSNKLDIEANLQHIEKGYKYKGINIGTAAKNYDLLYEYRLNYIETPLLIKLNGNRFSYKFGPVFSYLYQANYRYVDVTRLTKNGVTSIYPSSYFGPYPNDRYRKFDFGLMLGIDYRINDNISLMLETSKHFVRTDFVGPQRRYNDIMFQQVYFLGIKYKLKKK